MDPCCCDRLCLIESDDFNRADNTDLGAKWTEVTGDSEIDTNRLLVPGGGLVITTKRHPINTPTGIVYATLKNMQPGNEYIVFLNYDPTSGTYEGVKLVCDSPTQCTISLTSGADSKSGLNYVQGGDLILRVCRSLRGIYAGITTIDWPVWDCVSDAPGGRYAGVKNPGSNTVYFDDFAYMEHELTNPDCPACMCECDGYCLPKSLTLTLISTCAHRNGITIPLVFDTSAYGLFQWYGEATIPTPLDPGLSSLNKFRLFCRDNGISPDCAEGDFWICTEGFQQGQCSSSEWFDASSSDCVSGEGKCSDGVVCNPLTITFGPSTCEGSAPPDPPPSCTESLVVTI